MGIHDSRLSSSSVLYAFAVLDVVIVSIVSYCIVFDGMDHGVDVSAWLRKERWSESGVSRALPR